jgi:hypothetical protein
MSKKRHSEPAEYGFRREQEGASDYGDGNSMGRGDVRRAWRLRCSHPGCDAVLDHGGGAYMDGSELAANAKGNGWRVAPGLKPLCRLHCPPKSAPLAALPSIISLPSECYAPDRPPPRKENPPMLSAPAEASPAIDLRLMVTVTEHLQEYFDKERGRYLNDWSDAKVATETGAAEAFVKKIRLAAFGELAEDPIMTELRRAIEQHKAECTAMVAAADKRAEDLLRRFNSYVQSKRSK